MLQSLFNLGAFFYGFQKDYSFTLFTTFLMV